MTPDESESIPFQGIGGATSSVPLLSTPVLTARYGICFLLRSRIIPNLTHFWFHSTNVLFPAACYRVRSDADYRLLLSP